MSPSTRLHCFASLVLAALLSALGCTASIGDMGGGPGPGVGPGETGGPGEPEGDPAQCLLESDGQAGSACEVAEDCAPPFVCLDGACVGPQSDAVTCDPIEGKDCEGPNEVCVAGLCVINPGNCSLHDDCPLGYLCGPNGQCQPERDGQACTDPGPGPDLTGTYASDSVLHLREGLPGVVDGILDVSEDLRDLVNGDIDLGLGSAIDFLIGGLVAGVIRSYVPPWGIDLVTALGDLSDMLDTMRIEGTMQIQGQVCDANYRIKETWEWVIFEYRGQELRFTPDNLPGVPGGSQLEPDEYQAFYSCGVLYLDRHRVQDTMSGLIRFLVDTVVQAATGYQTIEDALANVIDCYAVGNHIGSLCDICGAAAPVATSACRGFVNTAANKVGQEVDEAAVEMSLIKVKGTALVGQDGTISDGRWAGSLVGGDFPGEFTLERR